jgi:hypothetical protein
MDENKIIHGDKTNCPAPADRIGPMSERDPSTKNAVNPNFNDNISNNALDLHPATKTTPPQTSGTRKLPVFRSHITNVQQQDCSSNWPQPIIFSPNF